MPTISSAAALTEVRDCTGTDLLATAEQATDSVMGNLKLIVKLRNIGETACAMPEASPTLSGVDGSESVPLNSRGGGTYFGNPPSLSGPLIPGGVSELWIGLGLPDYCPDASPKIWSTMELAMPDGSTIRFASAVDTRCGSPSVSLFGSPP
jgi:hypothetical protein